MSDAHAERRAKLRRLAAEATVRAHEYRARESAANSHGRVDKAKQYATTAARAERLALTNQRELDRLDNCARRLLREGSNRAERAAEMKRAQDKATAAAAALPPVDPLQAYGEALEIAAGLEAEAKRQDARADGYIRSGDAKRAAFATGGAATSRDRAAAWRAEAEKTQAGTSRNLARELALSIRARARADDQGKATGKRLARAGIEASPDTAAGQRYISTGGRGRGKAIAALSPYAALIRKPGDRTAARLEAMEDFDALCGAADAGLYPPPRFESESTGSKGPGDGVMANRAAGVIELDMVAAAIGAPNLAMLRGWIVERRTLAALSREGFGSDRTIGALALAALDALAIYLRTRNALAARLEPVKRARISADEALAIAVRRAQN
jgi:hypothetical protein